jgi:hypothetical protein
LVAERIFRVITERNLIDKKGSSSTNDAVSK